MPPSRRTRRATRFCEQYGELERYTLHYSGCASEAGIERVELSDWQETTATAQFPLALYALVDGKYLVPDGELAAGTAYLALDSMGLRGRNVIPLESITMLTRIRYAARTVHSRKAGFRRIC